MKIRFKYIHFAILPPNDRIEGQKGLRWSCRNNQSRNELGVVKWFSPWKQFCYFPNVQAVYKADCLADIKTFIEGISKDDN